MKQTAPLEIGLPVIDLPKMVDFYSRVFGCEEVRRADIPAELSRAIGVTDEGYENVWMRFPGGEVVKLVRPKSPPQLTPVKAFSADSTGIAYFTLYCDDIAAAIARAVEQGAQLVSEPGLAEESNPVRLAFLRDPEGNVFEFVQATPN